MDALRRIFQNIITLLTVTVLFLITFLNLILGVPRTCKRIKDSKFLNEMPRPLVAAMTHLIRWSQKFLISLPDLSTLYVVQAFPFARHTVREGVGSWRHGNLLRGDTPLVGSL
jgi:hypothetical protein